MIKWIEFHGIGCSKSHKTLRWTVVAKNGEGFLGDIKWFASWRRYAFFPALSTVFEQDCLRDIAMFLENQTFLHKEKLKKEKANA